MHTVRLLVLAMLLGGLYMASDRVSAAESPAPASASAGLVDCPQCLGEGSSPCKAHCKDGKVRCPATCLKQDDPGWVPGPEGKTVKHFPVKKKGMSGDSWWSTGHLGQLIVYEDGMPVNKGVCPTCKGTGLIDCKACVGTGRLTCALCKGSKRVLQADADAYAAKKRDEFSASSITLGDGRVLHGKIISRSDTQVVIKTEDGKMVSVKPEELVEKPKEGSPAPTVEDKK